MTKINKANEKTKKLKTKLKGNRMELNPHKVWKPWEEKSHRLWSKTQNQKFRLKAPQRVVKKNFSGPTYDTSISHLDPMIFNYHLIRKFSEWSEMETIELTKYNLISWWEMYFIGWKCIMKYWWPEHNYMSLQNHRQPVDN